MTTILLILCFALLALAFFLIILLYLKISQLKDVEKKQERLLKEFEHVITSYVMEIKEENEVFLNRIKHMNQPYNDEKIQERDGPNPEEKSDNKRVDLIELELTSDDLQDLLPSNYDEEEELKEQKLTETDNKEESSEKDAKNVEILFKDIEHLIKLGLSYEEIAKKLNKGKTEIELLHKFRQNH